MCRDDRLTHPQFAGKGRIVICGETELFYGTLAAEGAHITDL
jgi:hypothetical protein